MEGLKKNLRVRNNHLTMLADSGERRQNWGQGAVGGFISAPRAWVSGGKTQRLRGGVSVCMLELCEGSFIYVSGLTQKLGLSTGAPTCGLSLWFGFLKT